MHADGLPLATTKAFRLSPGDMRAAIPAIMPDDCYDRADNNHSSE